MLIVLCCLVVLCVVCWLFVAVRSSLFVVICCEFVGWCLLVVACSLLRVVCCSLCAA